MSPLCDITKGSLWKAFLSQVTKKAKNMIDLGSVVQHHWLAESVGTLSMVRKLCVNCRNPQMNPAQDNCKYPRWRK